MRLGIVHTHASPCRCHETLLAAFAELGHEGVDVDSEDVPLRAGELAGLDLVFDQTDRFRGEGLLRPVVRQLLEARGARCVGTDARGSFLADDKAAAKARLAAAGVPVVRGAVVTVPEPGPLPFPFPRVVKPVFEHLSRSLALCRDGAEQRAAIERALAVRRAPVLVEPFVPGRELAATVIVRDGRPVLLPIVAWPVAEDGVLDYAAKRDGEDASPAALAPAVAAAIEGHALRAFAALGLADWARFDVRLAADGTPWFLEANTKPSLEAGSPCLVAAREVGLSRASFIGALIDAARLRYKEQPQGG